MKKLSDFVVESNGKSINTISTDRILCIVGKQEILDIEPNDNTVLISITEPGHDYIPEDTRNKYLDVLNIQFWDTTIEQVEKFKTYNPTNKTIVDCITYDEAKTIYDFIMKHQDKQFAVHCSAGISRSAATAHAILCLLECDGDIYQFRTGFDNPISKHWRYSPNSTVFDRIMTHHLID